jgi:hypothetical protein
MNTTSNIDWSNYKSLPRADKAERMNKFDRTTSKLVMNAPGDAEWMARVRMERSLWVNLFRGLTLTASEIAEAILLTDPHFVYAVESPVNSGTKYERESDSVIDRAMDMATQWNEDGYADCFCMHETGHTHLGGTNEMLGLLSISSCSDAEAQAIEAGCIAAKAAADVMNFLMMTADGQEVVAG